LLCAIIIKRALESAKEYFRNRDVLELAEKEFFGESGDLEQ